MKIKALLAALILGVAFTMGCASLPGMPGMDPTAVAQTDEERALLESAEGRWTLAVLAFRSQVAEMSMTLNTPAGRALPLSVRKSALQGAKEGRRVIGLVESGVLSHLDGELALDAQLDSVATILETVGGLE